MSKQITKLANGKGGGEHYTAHSLATLLGVPIRKDKNFANVTRHNVQFLEISSPEQIAALRLDAEIVAQELAERVDLSAIRLLAYNPDIAGAAGNRADIALLDSGEDFQHGISVKANNPEKGSFRYNQSKIVSPIVGLEYTLPAINRLKEIWSPIYNHQRMRCADRSDLVRLVDEIVDVEVGELYWALQRDPSALYNHLTKMAYGNDRKLIEVSYLPNTAKTQYKHKIETDFPSIVGIFAPKVIASGDDTFSRTLQIPVLTETNTRFDLNIRYKNGSEYTHHPSGRPKTFLKTSITRD